MNVDPPHDLRDLEAPQAAPLDQVKELEIALSTAQVELLKKHSAFCKSCGKEMNKGGTKAVASTGTCVGCLGGSSRVVEVQANGSHKLISRQERRHPNGLKNRGRHRS